jgi:hypothetical protein
MCCAIALSFYNYSEQNKISQLKMSTAVAEEYFDNQTGNLESYM